MTGVFAQSATGQSISVSADHFVICAGAIETTRLLLILNRQHDERLFPAMVLGRYLNDHISSNVARIQPTDAGRLNRLAGFRFEGSTMRSLRFELSREAQIRERVGSAFAHISFRTEQATGFDALRDFMRGLQQKGRADLKRLLDTLRDSPYLMRLVLWRAVYRQLLWPVPAQYELHLVAEQLPQTNNRISLGTKTDRFQLPLAAIKWGISAEDVKTFAVFRKCFERFWTRKGLLEIGKLAWTLHDEPGSSLSGTDVYHPGGTTRMGSDRHSAIVNADLRTFELPNLWLSSTSVFPSGGGENPTLTLILFTLRLADHLCAQLK
jgi:choline dehydrogenase-like flavoprotein